MVQLLGTLVAAGIILSIFTGPIGLALTLPATVALFFVLRSRQSATRVDSRFTGGASRTEAGPRDGDLAPCGVRGPGRSRTYGQGIMSPLL